MSARILLHDNQLCERGTTTSMIDYARALRSRGHDVEISHWAESPANVPAVVERVRSEFVVHSHLDRYDLGDTSKGYDAGYFIKSGQNDGLILAEGQSLVHAVFQVYEHMAPATRISRSGWQTPWRLKSPPTHPNSSPQRVATLRTTERLNILI